MLQMTFVAQNILMSSKVDRKNSNISLICSSQSPTIPCFSKETAHAFQGNFLQYIHGLVRHAMTKGIWTDDNWIKDC